MFFERLEQNAEGDFHFLAREARADAHVHAVAERDVLARVLTA